MTTRRLPPFGKQFADGRARGLVPRKLGLGHLVVVLDWNEPSGATPSIVMPHGSDPSLFNLEFVAGLHVTISHSARHIPRVAAVVDALLTAGAARVDAVNREALAHGDSLDAAWPTFEREARYAA